MLLLGHDELIGLLPPLQIIDAVEAALRARAANEVIMPPRQHMNNGNNAYITMPALAAGSVGVKVIAVIPGNAARHLPTITGVMVLTDANTGATRAIMDAGSLTALRTGAVGALGMKHLTPESTASAGIVGCGIQGTWQAIFACAVRPLRELFCLSRSTGTYDKFVAVFRKHCPEVKVTRCHNARELLKYTDVIIAATSSSEPVLPNDREMLANKHFISVGSFKATMQEFPDAVYALAGVLAVDSENALHEAGDILNAIRRGLLKETDVFSIAEHIAGRRRINISQTTAYKCVGAAIFDLYVAEALFLSASLHGVGREMVL
jgi:ornithine cyclodeaminase